ncbi:AGL353Wp [Eremothecium gossypii ATCC 10895]|uniref:1,3-beta-glucan synthase n=1 Tax=Eremothecium gossypii (strain ATCC 10895 / CBS 109.51 / FGSC 9923 / NRRL Y-1056) TaxID=284811 RepID=Q751P2_EREGS|nr:AGL353Wp [Eremothecium gossypii ATCC 10895]AAS54138.1 AGL353Wp [Eremothecium gossypii ATCC 10895]AEY98464.1 FAGL353Wp [Eremothecium gossypii FDAG1]
MNFQNPSPALSQTDLQYPAWCQDDQVPVTKSELKDIFDDLARKFGFQQSSKENMYHHLLTQLDSRASRTTAQAALISLHASYIGGDCANYKKWYFAAQLNLDEEIGFSNMRLQGKSHKRNKRIAKEKGISIKEQQRLWKERQEEFMKNHPKIVMTPGERDDDSSFKAADFKWKLRMRDLTPAQMARQLALYLLVWGEANQLRFTPECLCFIFKCAYDYDTRVLEAGSKVPDKQEFAYLNDIVTPIYRFLRNQIYEVGLRGKLLRRDNDHKDIIGYDDVNQLFWYPEGIERIVLKNGDRLVDKSAEERYEYLREVAWDKVFYKTYRESRSWMHCATNFNRIWIIHFATFWFFTSFNAPTLYTKNYIQLLNNQPTMQSRFSAIALGGAVTCLVQIVATLFEWTFVPREWPGAQHLSRRMLGLIICFVINFGPSVYVFGFFDLDEHSRSAYVISIVQFVIALTTTFFFAMRPLGGLFTSYLQRGKHKRRYVSSQTFTASFPKLTGRSKWFSRGLWICVFVAKFLESYFFLTLSLRDPIRVLSILDMSRCRGDRLLRDFLCRWQPSITLFLMLLTDLVLFFLDTYLWYIICNCIFSIMLSFSLGTSILTPWKNIYSRLPKRIYTKILATSEMDIKYKPKILISQVWNAIVISMYREHLLSIDHVQKLLYQQVDSIYQDKRTLKSPTFFLAQDDSTFKSMEFFPRNSEAQRRLSFFAQSLSTPIIDPIPVECMPTFTVLIPHYAEKLMLKLKEIIKEESPKSRITLLEYLKHLHPTEWECFVHDTKLLAIEKSARYKHEKEEGSDESLSPSMSDSAPVPAGINNDVLEARIKDLPFYCLGFGASDPEDTLRTRIWASLRTQTLYRTISGFMNYSKAIKLLYRIENPSMIQFYAADEEALDNDLNAMANRKFKMVVAMQRYAQFTPDETECVEFIWKAYPEIMVSYLLEEPNPNDPDGEPIYYSCLTDGTCSVDPKTGRRENVYKIRLSGNPILGDGKSDNQNNAIIFYRGEYIQVIDANQDNYLEECLKIRSVLGEFEEMEMDNFIPYIPGIEYQEQPPPVAIIGAREYIFSENIGVLGDIAAGKEQTFGTLFARTLAEIGAKLHYGHPDFLNAIFMTTRGGISKAQKGLHLNEDIYAGMNAICRGGRIKHSDYYQCGKGRDLGFGSILNFTTKIGAGMGEQLLSREYYYLGTQLSIDRFLTFFYAHPGFHLNNLFITLSVQLFFLLLLNLGALNHETITCMYNKDIPITNLERPIGCYNLQPVLHWVTIFVLSIFIVFFISFAPLLIQELLEKGIWKACSRFIHHLLCMAPLFEVFVCQIYSNALFSNVTFGGAKYIPTGRGFAITRMDFHHLYSRFAATSIYSGSRIFLMLLFATTSMWQPALLWFWITVVSLSLAPFIFNPHQYSFVSYFVDYRNFVKWLFRGNSRYHPDSWSSYVKSSRSQYTGYKKKLIGDKSELSVRDTKKAAIGNLLFAEVLIPFFTVLFSVTAYTFINAQTGVSGVTPTHALIRLAIITFIPIIVNALVLGMLFGLSFAAAPILIYCCQRTGAAIAGIALCASVAVYIVDFELMWFLEGWNFTRALLLLITCINIQNFLFKIVSICILTREYKNNKSHIAWWSGKWYNTGIGWQVIFQPAREYLVKIIESSFFAGDFILGHWLLFLQTPILFFPYIDHWHSTMLFWLKPGNLISGELIFTNKQRKARRSIVRRYTLLYFLIMTIFIALLVAPIVAQQYVPDGAKLFSGSPLDGLAQPNNQDNNDTDTKAPRTILRTTPRMPQFKTVR